MGLVFVPAATRHFAGRLKHRRTLRCITCTPVHYRRFGFISTIPELDRTPTPNSADCPAATPKAIYKVSHPMRPLCLRSLSGDKKTGPCAGIAAPQRLPRDIGTLPVTRRKGRRPQCRDRGATRGQDLPIQTRRPACPSPHKEGAASTPGRHTLTRTGGCPS